MARAVHALKSAFSSPTPRARKTFPIRLLWNGSRTFRDDADKHEENHLDLSSKHNYYYARRPRYAPHA